MRTRPLSLVVAAGLLASSCAGSKVHASDGGRIQAAYDPQTGRLERLRYDADGEGRFDTSAYFDGARITRIEADTDGNGSVDRWEYYGPDQRLQKVGVSAAGHSAPTTWIPVGEACGTAAAIVRAAEAAGLTATVIPTRPAAGADR